MIQTVKRLLLLASCAFLLNACSLISPKAGSGSKSEQPGTKPSNTGSAFTPSGDPRKDLREALEKLNTAYPYRLTETMSALTYGSNTMPASSRVVEFQASDRTHMKYTGGGGDFEAISIGDKHYWYANGKWTEGSVPQGRAGGVDFAKRLAEMVKDVKYVGPEMINGVACHAYTCVFDGSASGQSWTGTSKVWIGANDGLPHESDSDLKFSNYSGKSHIVYEYDGNIKITPPAM